MTTYNTGNPIGSTEVKDLYDNAQNFDTLANTTTLENVPDRLGVPRMTLHGFEQAAGRSISSFEQASGESLSSFEQEATTLIELIKFQPPIPYAPGIEVTTSSLTVDYLGVIYYALPSAIPFTTGAWNSAQWSPVQNTFPGNELLVFDNYIAASASAATLPDGQRVNVEADETKFGRSTKHRVQAGALVYIGLAANADSVLYGERTQAERNADIVTVKDNGAIGSGVDDDTEAVDQTMADTGAPYFPDGTYLYNGDVNALFSKPIFGAGIVRYAGFDYPAVRGDALNALWAGEFRCWQMGHAFTVETTQRRQIPAGVTHARLNLTGGTTVYHIPGTHLQDALRVQRNAGDVSTDSHVAVMNLTREETEPLVGKRCVLQFNGRKGETYSGSGITVRVQYSVEQEQPILNSDGTYTSGNVNLLEQAVVLGAETRPEAAQYFFTFDLPENATQMAIVLVVPFAGTAGENDYVEVEGFSVHPGNRPANILRESFSELMLKAKTRYQSTLPYGAPRGTNTEQGSISAVAINTAASFSFQMSVRFEPPMALPPQFIFQSPTSGTESRLLNKDTGANINGLAYALSEAGAVITNSAAAIAGNRYLCHWTAHVIF